MDSEYCFSLMSYSVWNNKMKRLPEDRFVLHVTRSCSLQRKVESNPRVVFIVEYRMFAG